MQKYLKEVEEWLDRLYIAAEGATLRKEDRRKACEVAAMMEEIERAASRFSRRSSLLLVDAAAGKSYVGLLAAKLILPSIGCGTYVVTIECDRQRVEASRRAAERLCSSIPIDCRQASVETADAWPSQPSIITALHACGEAADAIIDRAIACRTRVLLLVPCCTSESVAASRQAQAQAEALGIPRHAPVRRRFIQSFVDAERTLRLESAGYETEVVEFVAPTVTPHNVLWRARLVGEPQRMKSAQSALASLLAAK
ncbi:MAG: methyltransferase [Acidobacteria bacterium]|nr:methyltransferase [Acidobacteriota bacterium]